MPKPSLYFVAALYIILLTGFGFAQPVIELQHVPDNGIHPRIIKDNQQIAHLLYFRPESPNTSSALGNLYYRQYDLEREGWQDAVKVSSKHLGGRRRFL